MFGLDLVALLVVGLLLAFAGAATISASGGSVMPGPVRIYNDFVQEPVTSKRLGGAVTGATGDRNQALFPGHGFVAAMGLEWHVKGTQTILTPVLTANGWDIAMDQTASDGIELTNGILARGLPVSFNARTSPAFYFKVRAKVGDASGANPFLIGFRKAEPYQAAHSSYNEIYGIGIIGTSNPNLIKTYSITAGGAAVTTDTTMTWADAATKGLAVLVAADGTVSYQIDTGSGYGAPTVVPAAVQITSALDVVPFVYFLQAADVCDTLELIEWDCGLQ